MFSHARYLPLWATSLGNLRPNFEQQKKISKALLTWGISKFQLFAQVSNSSAKQ
jgi:hypothetical protein